VTNPLRLSAAPGLFRTGAVPPAGVLVAPEALPPAPSLIGVGLWFQTLRFGGSTGPVLSLSCPSLVPVP